jgi:hypothetical protein
MQKSTGFLTGSGSLPFPRQNREGWLDSVEKTELLQNLKPVAQGAIVPTLLLSGTLAMVTGDLGRASAVLPLDIGVSLRGVTPLAVVSCPDGGSGDKAFTSAMPGYWKSWLRWILWPLLAKVSRT